MEVQLRKILRLLGNQKPQHPLNKMVKLVFLWQEDGHHANLQKRIGGLHKG